MKETQAEVGKEMRKGEEVSKTRRPCEALEQESPLVLSWAAT